MCLGCHWYSYIKKMKIAFLYLGIAAMGYLIAAFLGKEKDKFKWIGTVLPGIVTALIFLMGFRIGENEEVVGNQYLG